MVHCNVRLKKVLHTSDNTSPIFPSKWLHVGGVVQFASVSLHVFSGLSLMEMGYNIGLVRSDTLEFLCSQQAILVSIAILCYYYLTLV